jgi:hypothetical protein
MTYVVATNELMMFAQGGGPGCWVGSRRWKDQAKADQHLEGWPSAAGSWAWLEARL